MIVKLNKNYFNIYINRIMLLLLNIQFISYEFADSICEEIRKDIDLYSSFSFLCIENDILSGMLIARSIGEYVPNKNTCEIKYLSVNPDFKRKGIASSLVEYLKTRCGSYFDCIYLTVYEKNSNAIASYKQIGVSLYTLDGKPQVVLRDEGTSNEHTDMCM